MKYLFLILKISIIIISILLIILLLNYFRLNLHYYINKNKYKETFNIYGNKDNYVPQGLTYSDKYNVVLQTSYNSKHKPSKLYVIDFETGKLIKELKLLVNNKESINHVGGISTDNNRVWITSEYEVSEFSLEEIINTNNDYIECINYKKTPIRGDFSYYKNDVLWIGDFFLNPFYKVPNNNPLLMGYKVKNNIDYNKPDIIISIPKMVQGMVITDDNKFIFTQSFTNLINSKLSIYNNVLEEENDYYELNGNKIPYYKFNKKYLYKIKKLPPMAEGLFIKDNELYILFESSSNTYFYALPKIKKVIKYKY